MPPAPTIQIIHGRETCLLEGRHVRAGVTLRGGHLWPADFCFAERTVSPLALSPWHPDDPEVAGCPEILRTLRGDFFCLPFGGNSTPYGEEIHPVHGESANGTWTPTCTSAHEITLTLPLSVRAGELRKTIRVSTEAAVIYQRHEIVGLSGPMSYGMHAMLHPSAPVRISTSRFVRGQVLPEPFENPATGGYQCLLPGARFSSLQSVPHLHGGTADLSLYPSREGFEDLVMISSPSDDPLAWTAAVCAEQGWLWFQLKSPRDFPSTIFWISNGGRHYAPWNGRHRGVIGIEEVNSYFHHGLAESVTPNSVNAEGIPTCAELDPERPLSVSTIMGMAEIPASFTEVASVDATESGITIRSTGGELVEIPVDLTFFDKKVQNDIC